MSKRARICVDALAVCCLEVQDVMMRQLPSVLLRLSQISATVAMAIPLMEFLSGKIMLCVFAITVSAIDLSMHCQVVGLLLGTH